MVAMQADMLLTLQSHQRQIRSLGVRRLAIFGSWARGDASPESDVDVPVDFERKSFDACMDLKFLLEEVIGRPVNLVLRDGVKPALREQVMRELVHVLPAAQGIKRNA